MLLREMFSAIGAPKEEEGDINWIEDLKFFIDNETDVLNRFFFPAIRKHKQYGDRSDAYKIYIKPIERCKDAYVEKYQIDEPGTKFPKGDLIVLARKMAEEQNQHIKNGDYED